MSGVMLRPQSLAYVVRHANCLPVPFRVCPVGVRPCLTTTFGRGAGS